MLKTRNPSPRALWHVTPLENLEDILRGQCLLPLTNHSDHLPHPPRAGKTRLRRRQGNVVYLAPTARSRFHRWHVREGIPCIQLVFSPDLIANPEVGLVRCNGKAWRHRDDFRPVKDPQEKQELLAQWRVGKWPSLECVVPHRLPLDHHWWGITFPETARETIFSLLRATGLVPETGFVPPLPSHRGRPLWDTIPLPESTAVWLRAESMLGRLVGLAQSDVPVDYDTLVTLSSVGQLGSIRVQMALPASPGSGCDLTGIPIETSTTATTSIS